MLPFVCVYVLNVVELLDIYMYIDAHRCYICICLQYIYICLNEGKMYQYTIYCTIHVQIKIY